MAIIPAIYPDLHHLPPVAVRGEGVYIYDEAGRRYLDGCSGALVSNLGHGRTDLAQVMAEQAAQLAFVYRTQFANRPALALAERITAHAPGDLHYAYFVNSGSEANEIAMKMAQQYWREVGKPTKRHLISRWTSYHGSTAGALSLSGNVGRRRAFPDHLEPFPSVMAPYCFQCPAQKEYPSCQLACAQELEVALQRLGPENVAAFVAEPVIGASGGAITPPEGYYQTIREICDRYEILFIADEVMTGFGRTGRWFGMEHWGVTPDLMVVGKGISAGYTPLAGVLVGERVHQAFHDGSGGFSAGHTLANNPLSAAVGCKVLDILEEEDLVAKAASQGEKLRQGLLELSRRHPQMADIRGKGMMLGFELVADPATGKPFPFDQNVTGAVRKAAFARGLLIYPCRGAIGGAAGDAFLVAPPLTSTDSELDELLHLLDGALTDWEAR